MSELVASEVILTGSRRASPVAAGTPGPTGDGFAVMLTDDPHDLMAHRGLRREAFVEEQGLFSGSDRDSVDDDPRCLVLVARAADGEILGGVRVHPTHHTDCGGRDLGWWCGSRLVVSKDAQKRAGAAVGAALVRAACAVAEGRGALRFDATVQSRHAPLFGRLGWVTHERLDLHGHPHVRVDWPIQRIQRLADATKAALGGLLGGLVDSQTGFLGDDGAPVPGSDLIAACDAILPSMVERDPEWAGWCAVLVNLNDLCAMGAAPVGILDSVAARDASFARRILRGLAEAAAAWGVPVLGGHTQLGVPAALSVTALGRTDSPVPGAGGRPGNALRVIADLGGGWRPGYTGAQWDSSSHRTSADLRALGAVVATLRPNAAKDVSMSGLVGTTGMLAEASGCRAELDVAAVPTPAAAAYGDWLTCFPGFAMITAEQPVQPRSRPANAHDRLPQNVESASCGVLVEGAGVGLRWPDGVLTEAITSPVTGLGAA